MRKIAKRPVCVLSLAFMLVIWLIIDFSGGIDISEKVPDYTDVAVQGKIEDKSYKNNRNVIFLDKYIVELSKQDISDFRIGQLVKISGVYSNFPVAENKGQFCSRTYYRTHGYEAKVVKAEITHCSESYDVYGDFLYNIKERTKSVYKNNMPDDYSGTVTAMVLGDKTELDDETKTLYQNAGISHILSLSGLHIATVGLFVFSMLLKLGAGTYPSSIISSLVMLSYGVMTGLSTSTLRALIMFFLSIIARCIGRTYDLLSAVCFSAVLILAENPYYIYDSGFLMSFLSVVGIGLIYPVLNAVTGSWDWRGKTGNRRVGKSKRKISCLEGVKEERERVIGQSIDEVVQGKGKSKSKTKAKAETLWSDELCKLNNCNVGSERQNRLSGKILNTVRQSMCISMSATLATLPVVADSFFKISRYSIFINIVVVPLMGLVLFSGIAGGIAGFFGLHNLSCAVLRIAGYVLQFYDQISAFSGNLPGNMWIIGQPSPAMVIIYVIILFIAFLGIGRWVSERIADFLVLYTLSGSDEVDIKYKEGIFTKVYCVVTFVAIAAALFVISFRFENDFEIDVLSVGQGACNVIHGSDIPTIMIDGGSSDEKKVGKYRVIPNLLSKGIDEIDYLFVTHPDEDHISAVRELLYDKTCGIKVNALVFSIVDDEIMQLSDECGVPVYSFNEGQTIAGRDYEIKAIYPKYRQGMTWQSGDANENSLVLKITHKPSNFTALFTGDIGVTAENTIIENSQIEHKHISTRLNDYNVANYRDVINSYNDINGTNIINNHNVSNYNNVACVNGIMGVPYYNNVIYVNGIMDVPNYSNVTYVNRIMCVNNVNNISNISNVSNDQNTSNIHNIDFMTIAHHGSKNSSSEQFLAYTNPSICTISAGRNNSYGHPHKSTLDKLDSLQIPYLITYECGEINVNVDDGKAWVEKFMQ